MEIYPAVLYLIHPTIHTLGIWKLYCIPVPQLTSLPPDLYPKIAYSKYRTKRSVPSNPSHCSLRTMRIVLHDNLLKALDRLVFNNESMLPTITYSFMINQTPVESCLVLEAQPPM